MFVSFFSRKPYTRSGRLRGNNKTEELIHLVLAELCSVRVAQTILGQLFQVFWSFWQKKVAPRARKQLKMVVAWFQ